MRPWDELSDDEKRLFCRMAEVYAGFSEYTDAQVGRIIDYLEETGQLEHMLSKIADFYEAEVDAKVKALTSLIEPIMIMVVGGIVGFIVIAMYLPIFKLYDSIR